MHNIIDYLSWRGDLRFSQSELNEVDMLIFSQLVHAPLEKLFGRGSGYTLAELEPMIYSIPPDKSANELEQQRYRLWHAAARAQRFSAITLGSFASMFDAESQK